MHHFCARQMGFRLCTGLLELSQMVVVPTHLPGALPQERRSTLSHCVAKPLAQLKEGSNLDSVTSPMCRYFESDVTLQEQTLDTP